MDKVIAFDLEIAHPVPEGEELDDHHPLGISVAALYDGGKYPGAWYGNKGGAPAHRMSAPECCNFVRHLETLISRGHTLVTWNGFGFDFRVLAEESGMVDECERLALGHIDMMFHLFCLRGFAVSLQATAEGMEVEGKLEGVAGADAPRLWADGEYDRVLEYVGQDVRATMNVYRAVARAGRFSWITKAGNRRNQEVNGGELLRVYEAIDLPEPDTSWMKKTCSACDDRVPPEARVCPGCGGEEFHGGPWPRHKFTGWLKWP
jgi:hypothetical protein